MGAGYAQQIAKELPLIQDAELNRYLNVLGDSIARIADSRNLDWQFSIVDSKDVNAFAVPGGFIYVNRGLIERATNMSQVAGVLGHEIGHVTMRHSIQQMQKAQGANIGVTAVCVLTNICNSQATSAAINIGANAAFATFSRQDEDEADKEGVQYMITARIDPAGFPGWFAQFLPRVAIGQPATLFKPATVSDRSDGKIAHLDGLNLSRAWALRSIARQVDRDGIAERADRHLAAALPHIAGDYMGEHWLASFALLALTA